MRMFLALVGLLILPSLAFGQTLTVAPSAGANIFITDGPDGKVAEKVGDLWTKLEVQMPLGEYDTHWMSVLGYYDGDDFGGFGLRYYNRVSEGVFPGFGFNVTILDAEREQVDQLTVMLGGEFLLEVWVPGPGDTTFPITLLAGMSVDVVGSDVTMIPLGLSIPLDLFQ